MANKSNAAPPEFKQAVGAVIKTLRTETGLTQGELAERLGASHASAVSAIELGKYEPYLFLFFKICRELEREPVSVLYDIETELLEAGFWEEEILRR